MQNYNKKTQIHKASDVFLNTFICRTKKKLYFCVKLLETMKKTLCVPIAFACLLAFDCQCTEKKEKDDDTLQIDTIQPQVLDSTLWGRMGEGTSMNVMEFITDGGDTLYLSRTSEQTEQEAEMIGDLRNFTDRFAITTRGANVDEGTSIQTCINVSQLMGTWKNSSSTLALYVDGSADNGVANYKSWKVMNGKLILSGKVTTEYGETDRIDTINIVQLDDDSLKYVTPQHEIVAFGK